MPHRCYAKPSRFAAKKKRVEVLEQEAPQQGTSVFGSYQQQYQQQSPPAGAPSSTFPSYVGRREEEREQQAASQWDVLSTGAVEHMRKVYGTLAAGIGIAAGASMFAMATPLATVHPLIPGLAAMVPLMGLMYTNKHTHSFALKGFSQIHIKPLIVL